MLEEQDISKIRGAVKEELKTHTNEVLLPAFGQYTEEIVLPAIEHIVDNRIGKLRDDLTDVVDKRVLRAQDEITKALGKQIGESKEEILKHLKTDRERHKIFHGKVLDVFERSKLAEPEEIAAMRELVA